MIHKNSIVLCEMDNSTVNVYVNGVAIFVDKTQIGRPDKIANNSLSLKEMEAILNAALALVTSSKN